jgi:lipopolysaccharide heptosyltransferase II
MKFDKTRVKKILIIKIAAIGDVLLSTPVIENLRKNFPDAQINFLTQRYCRDVLTDNPFLLAQGGRVLTYDLSLGDSSRCIIKNIRKQKYDLVIDLFGNPRTALITYLSGAKYRTGYKFKGRSYAYNIKVKPRSGQVHNIEFNLDCLRKLDLEVKTNEPKLFLNGMHSRFAENFFAENKLEGKKIIGINPCGSWNTKIWYADYFAELMSKFSNGFGFILFWGGESEKQVCSKINDKAGNKALLIPEVDLLYAGALMKKCKIFLTNDTGPMHIAWTLGVKTAAIFGPTNPQLQGPLNTDSVIIRNEKLECLGCNLTLIEDCRYSHKCMKDLSVDLVYKKLIEMLKN